MLVLKVLDLREEGLEGGQLLIGPTHTQEVDVVTVLAVVLIALLKLYSGREGKERKERERG